MKLINLLDKAEINTDRFGNKYFEPLCHKVEETDDRSKFHVMKR